MKCAYNYNYPSCSRTPTHAFRNRGYSECAKEYYSVICDTCLVHLLRLVNADDECRSRLVFFDPEIHTPDTVGCFDK